MSAFKVAVSHTLTGLKTNPLSRRCCNGYDCGRKGQTRDGHQSLDLRGYWKVQEHIDGSVIWQCSGCKSVFAYREAFCPTCHSENRKISHDSVWMEEL